MNLTKLVQLNASAFDNSAPTISSADHNTVINTKDMLNMLNRCLKMLSSSNLDINEILQNIQVMMNKLTNIMDTQAFKDIFKENLASMRTILEQFSTQLKNGIQNVYNKTLPIELIQKTILDLQLVSQNTSTQIINMMTSIENKSSLFNDWAIQYKENNQNLLAEIKATQILLANFDIKQLITMTQNIPNEMEKILKSHQEEINKNTDIIKATNLLTDNLSMKITKSEEKLLQIDTMLNNLIKSNDNLIKINTDLTQKQQEILDKYNSLLTQKDQMIVLQEQSDKKLDSLLQVQLEQSKLLNQQSEQMNKLINEMANMKDKINTLDQKIQQNTDLINQQTTSIANLLEIANSTIKAIQANPNNTKVIMENLGKLSIVIDNIMNASQNSLDNNLQLKTLLIDLKNNVDSSLKNTQNDNTAMFNNINQQITLIMQKLTTA